MGGALPNRVMSTNVVTRKPVPTKHYYFRLAKDMPQKTDTSQRADHRTILFFLWRYLDDLGRRRTDCLTHILQVKD
jgi:hypothetical protein